MQSRKHYWKSKTVHEHNQVIDVKQQMTIFIGIRPLIRVIKNGFDFRPILWGFIQINNFYEIKKI